MQKALAFFVLIFILLTINIYLSFLVWFRYPKFLDLLLKLFNYADKLGLPLTKPSITYVQSSAYRWIVRFILMLILIILSLPVILMVIFF